jgi:antitoxin PrlF
MQMSLRIEVRQMKAIVTRVTQRGQVTIPAEVRRLLGLYPHSKVTFEIDGEQVRLTSAPFTIEQTYGSVKPLSRPEDFDAISRAAKEEHVERVLRKMREQ